MPSPTSLIKPTAAIYLKRRSIGTVGIVFNVCQRFAGAELIVADLRSKIGSAPHFFASSSTCHSFVGSAVSTCGSFRSDAVRAMLNGACCRPVISLIICCQIQAEEGGGTDAKHEPMLCICWRFNCKHELSRCIVYPLASLVVLWRIFGESKQ